MSVTRSQVITRYPEFSDIADGEYFDSAIAQAENEISRLALGNRAKDAILALTAHYLSMGRSSRGGNPGAVVSERVGDMQRSYAAPMMAEGNDLFSTSYGTQYRRIIRTRAERPLMI